MAPAGQLSGNFVHLAPDGSKHDFTRADNRLIRKARKAGQDSVDVSDVRLPTGMVLHFEVHLQLPAFVLWSSPLTQDCGGCRFGSSRRGAS